MSRIGLPMYITENGCPDSQADDWRRRKWILEYLAVVSKALQEGYDIRGFFYWTLVDNFEWHHGRTKHFGLMNTDRVLTDGGKLYANIVKNVRIGGCYGNYLNM